MRRPPLAAVLVLALAGILAAEEPSRGVVVDQAVRFVNDHVMTIGDIRSRNGVRTEMYRRQGKPLPDSPSTLIAFNRETLDELTDEELLVQKADELQVAIDHDRLGDEVASEAKRRGLGFRDMSTLRTIRERQAKIDAVLGWFESRSAIPGPEQLLASYQRHHAAFTRPPRAQCLLIALRPTPADERQALVKAMARLMRDAQGATDPQLRQAATGRLDAFLAADPAGQERLLGELLRDLAGAARPADAGDATLVTAAVRLYAQWGMVSDRARCQARLEALRQELLAMPPPLRGAAFREQALRISQGPHASDGGELGWVEPGTYGNEIEEQALAMPAFEPSAPFATGDALAMVLVIRREEGRTQSFAEVSSLLFTGLDNERRDGVRKRVTAVLRSQASVRDVVDLKDLVK